MIYAYKCPNCQTEQVSSKRGDYLRDECDRCGYTEGLKRVWAVNIHRPMADHYNTTTGTVIGSNRQFKEELKALSEAATVKTGIEHNYEPVDRQELRQQVEKSDAVGLESTNRQRVKDGKKPVDI